MTRTTPVADADKHSSDVNTLLRHKGKLFSGADDGKIKIWDENMKLVSTIDGAHTKSVFALAACEDTLYSGSNDGTVKSWSITTLKETGTLATGHREILKLVHHKDALYVGDSKGTLEVYVRDHLATAKNFIEPIRDMMVTDNLLYTVQELDLVIRLLKSKYGDFERRKTIMGSVPVCIAGDKLLYCTRSGKDICLRENSADINFKFISETQEVHEDRIHAMVGMVRDADTLLYTGGGDKIVKQWKVDGKCIVKMNTCPVKTGVNVMIAGEKGELFAGCRDGHMCRLDF